MHQSSTHVALSKLVTALNESRDVIMVDTLSCESFVKQTIVMARNIHKYRYRMGVGYKVAEDGTVTENYWENYMTQKKKKINQKVFLTENHARKSLIEFSYLAWFVTVILLWSESLGIHACELYHVTN